MWTNIPFLLIIWWPKIYGYESELTIAFCTALSPENNDESEKVMNLHYDYILWYNPIFYFYFSEFCKL